MIPLPPPPNKRIIARRSFADYFWLWFRSVIPVCISKSSFSSSYGSMTQAFQRPLWLPLVVPLGWPYSYRHLTWSLFCGLGWSRLAWSTKRQASRLQTHQTHKAKPFSGAIVVERKQRRPENRMRGATTVFHVISRRTQRRHCCLLLTLAISYQIYEGIEVHSSRNESHGEYL